MLLGLGFNRGAGSSSSSSSPDMTWGDGTGVTWGDGTAVSWASATFTERSAILDGDSLVSSQVWSVSSINTERRAAGFWTNTAAQLYQIFTTRFAQTYGASGNKIAAFLSSQATAISYVQANNIQAVITQLGANDIQDTGRSVAALTADYSTFIQAYLACSNAPFVFVGLPTPRGDWEGDLEATRATYVQRLNDLRTNINTLIDTTLASPRLKKFDSWNDIVDLTVTNATNGLTYFPKTGYMAADGIHLIHKGAHYHGKTLANAIKATSLWTAPTALPSTSGALNLNPSLTGITGTKGTGITGDVADNCRVERFALSPTAVCSIETTTIFGISQTAQKIVLTANAAPAEEIAFYFQYAEQTGASYAFDGTLGVEAVCPIKITATTGMDGIYLFGRIDLGSTYTNKDMVFTSGNQVPDSDLPLEWLLRTEPLLIPAGNPTRQQFVIRMRVDGTVPSAGCTVYIGQPVYRRATP